MGQEGNIEVDLDEEGLLSQAEAVKADNIEILNGDPEDLPQDVEVILHPADPTKVEPKNSATLSFSQWLASVTETDGKDELVELNR